MNDTATRKRVIVERIVEEIVEFAEGVVNVDLGEDDRWDQVSTLIHEDIEGAVTAAVDHAETIKTRESA